MAVRIPVIIDIDKAFDDAARRVDTAIKPMRRAIEDATADMRINVAVEGAEMEVMSLRDLLAQVRDNIGNINHNYAFDKLRAGLENTKRSFNELNAIIQKRGTPATFGEVESLAKLREAIVLMTQEIELRTKSARLVEEEAQRQIEVNRAIDAGNAALLADAKTMKEISDKVSALRGKLENIDPSTTEWTDTANEIKAATEELSRYQEKLKQITSPSPVAAIGSIDAIQQKMRQLQREWNAMAKKDKFDASGNLSAQAQRVVDDYKKLTEEATKYGKSLSEAAGKATTSVKNTTTALKTQSGVLNNLATTAMRYFSIYSVLRFAKQVRDVTGELEFQRVALGRLIQDEEYGAVLFEKIKEKAKESPFRIQQLVTYTKQLAAYRIEQEKLFDTTQMLADVSAGLGVEMNRLILAYGQVRSASVLRGQELRQFTEAGIPLVQLLADKFSDLNGKMVKTSEVFELISKRAVPFSMISEIFEDMTDKGGMFYQMQEKQAETLKGRWEKLKDAFDIGLQSVGDTKTFEFVNNTLIKGLTFLAKNLRIIPKLIEGMSAAWIVYYVATTRARRAVRALAMEEIKEAATKEASVIITAKGIKFADAYTKAIIRQRVASNALSKAFWKLWAAIIANPLGAILGALAGIASALLLFRKRTDEATNSFEKFDEIIEKTSKGLNEAQKMDKLIDRYETLAEKTDRTVREQNRLYQTMTRLQEAFPKVQIGIDGVTESIGEQVAALRDQNRIQEEAARRQGQEFLNARQLDLEAEEKKRTKLYKQQFELRKQLSNSQAKEGSSAYKTWTLELDKVNQQIEEQDQLIGKLQKRIQRLYYLLHPESNNNPFNAWQRQIQSMRDITVNGTTSQIFDDDQIEKWETLDAALKEIDSRKKKVREREDELSDSIKRQTGEIKEQIQAELDWARAERRRLEAMEEFFKTPTLFAESISKNFSDALAKTFDKGNIEAWGKNALAYLTMQTNLSFNPELLLARPMVDAAELVKKGWENAGDGIATVFSSIYDWEDKYGQQHNLMVTPILPDGTILSPEELDDYVKNVLLATNFKKDDKQLLLGVDVTPDAGERLHEMQERYYDLIQMNENLPEDFLISDKDLLGLRQASDVIDLAEKKIKAIEEEIAKIDNVNLENISDEELDKTLKYKRNLDAVYDVLKRIRDTYKQAAADDYSYLAQEIIDNFQDALARNVGNAKGSGVTAPLEFMISDSELKNINNATDLFDLLDKKISGVRKEIELASQQKEFISDEAQEQAEIYALTLQGILDKLLQMRGQYQEVFSGLSREVQKLFPTLMETFYAGRDTESFASTGLFSEADLMQIKNVVDLYDLWDSKISAVEAEIEKYNGQLADTVDLQQQQNIQNIIAQLGGDLKTLQELGKTYGFVRKERDKTPTTEDPWILIYKNRLKFVKDFSKGVQELNAFMSENNAILKERSIMEGRGLNLGFNGGKGELDVRKMTGSRQEVLKWYDDTIEKIKKKIRTLGGSMWSNLGVQAILAKDTKNRTIKAWQDLLAEVFKERTDFDLSQTQKDIEDAISKLKENIKRSEAARDFYKDILDMSGNEDLAASMTVSVYGDIGEDFKERMQQQLNAAMASLDANALTQELKDAFASQNFKVILANLNKFPEEWQKILLEMAEADEKYNADIVKNLMKTLQKAKTFSEKRVEIADRASQRLREIESLNVNDDTKNALRRRSAKKEAEDVEKLMYEAFKDTPLYIEMFSDLDSASSTMLRNMRNRIVAMKSQWKNLAPTELKELQSRLNEIDKQLAQRNPFKALTSSMKEYIAMGGNMARTSAEERASDARERAEYETDIMLAKKKIYESAKAQHGEENAITILAKREYENQKQVADKAQEAADSAEQTANNYKDVADNVRDAAEAMAKWSEYASSVANDAKKLASSFGSEDFAERFGIIADGATGFLSGAVDIAKGMALVSAGDLTGILPVINGIAEAVSSVVDAYHGINIKNINESIEEQDKLLEDLEYTYGRLDKAIAKSFGSDYIYNYREQLRILNAEAAAYAEQARLESEKGKKADEAKIEEYEKKEREALDRIKEMRPQLSEFFAGTDITSAAKDFAKAWIDAYRQFGNTTDAMGQKFKDMVDNMIINSLAGQAIQSMLKPIFDAIDAAATSGGKLTAQEMASISELASTIVPEINDSMSNLMSQLAHYGLNMRDNASGLTGIARDIQGASESSINGLAAAYNTQNFYISRIDQNVALILAALTGESVAGPNGAPAAAATNPYQDQMLEYVGSIPQMRDDIAAIRSLLSRVIIPKGITATHAVATRL